VEDVMNWLERIAVWSLAASVVCTVINGAIRVLVERGYAVPRWVLTLAALLNVVAANGDKAAQLAQGYRGPSVPMPKGWK
jgi:hypothetical protein